MVGGQGVVRYENQTHGRGAGHTSRHRRTGFAGLLVSPPGGVWGGTRSEPPKRGVTYTGGYLNFGFGP